MTAQCIPARTNTLTGSYSDKIAGLAAIAAGCWAIWYAATPAAIAALKFGMVGIGAAVALVAVALAIRHLLRRLEAEPFYAEEAKASNDWVADIRPQPVILRGNGAAEVVMIPQQSMQIPMNSEMIRK